MLMVPITIIMTIVIASIQYFHVHANPVFQLSGTMAFFHFHLLPTAATFCFKIHLWLRLQPYRAAKRFAAAFAGALLGRLVVPSL